MNSTCQLTFVLRNSSSPLPFVYLPNEWIIFEIVWPSIIFFGFTGNVMFIWTVKHSPSLHTSTFIFLASLAITDSLVLISVGLDFILDLLMTPVRYDDEFAVSLIFFFTTWFCFMSSLFLVTLVSVERYLAICHPIKHHLLKGTKRTIKLICIVFVGSCVFLGVTFPAFTIPVVICIVRPLDNTYISSHSQVVKLLPTDVSSFVGVFPQIMRIVAIVAVVFAFVANIYFYIRILQKLRKRKADKTLQTSATFERNIRQASLMVVANGMIFYICFTLFLAYMNFQLMVSFEMEIMNAYQNIILNDIFYTLVLINASINPLVYFITNSSYRHAFKHTLWTCLRRQPHNTNGTPMSIIMPMQRRP